MSPVICIHTFSEFLYNFDTVLYQFLEIGTSDITFMGCDQELKWLAFSLYPLSLFLYSLFKFPKGLLKSHPLCVTLNIQRKLKEWGGGIWWHPLWKKWRRSKEEMTVSRSWNSISSDVRLGRESANHLGSEDSLWGCHGPTSGRKFS